MPGCRGLHRIWEGRGTLSTGSLATQGCVPLRPSAGSVGGCHCPDLTLPWILVKAAATLPSPMKSSGSLQALRAVFPVLRAVVTAFPASGPGTVLACLARAESEPRHPGDWLLDCRSVKGHLLSASPPGLCAEPRCAGTVETTQSSL